MHGISDCPFDSAQTLSYGNVGAYILVQGSQGIRVFAIYGAGTVPPTCDIRVCAFQRVL